MNIDRIIFVGFQRKTFGICKKKFKTFNLREDEEIWKREKFWQKSGLVMNNLILRIFIKI